MEQNWRMKLRNYYDELREKFPVTRPGATDKLTIVAVIHMVPNSELLLEALSKIANVVVIPKSSQVNIDAEKRIKERFTVVDLEKLPKAKVLAEEMEKKGEEFSFKHAMRQENLAREILDTYVPEDHKLMVLDIGGYAAPALPELVRDPRYKGRFIAVSEGTKNGEDKYRKIVEEAGIPIFSRAVDNTKAPENYYVGPDCVRALDALMIKLDDSPLDTKHKIGLIGFGHVGEHLARALKQRHLEVTVHDADPARQGEDKSKAFPLIAANANKCTPTKEKDVIFLATGNQCLSFSDFGKMRNNVYIACATSLDDEMTPEDYAKLKALPHEEQRNGNGEIINETYNIDGKTINIIMGGKSVNFHMGTGVANPVLYLALGSWIAHVSHILNNPEKIDDQMSFIGDANEKIKALKKLPGYEFLGQQLKDVDPILRLPDDTQEKVAHIWLDHYGGLARLQEHEQPARGAGGRK